MRILVMMIGMLLSVSAFSQAENAARRRNFNHDNGVVMKDFDAVSYFKGKPLKGDIKYYVNYKGLKYLFASAENLEEFKKTPAKYEPAYGGWCAYSMSQGGKQVKIDPTAYKIVNGKLYLFSNTNDVNLLLKWNENEKRNKDAADRFWSKKMVF